jgi:3D (Asp-Asp-Asp) domain-containing protein
MSARSSSAEPRPLQSLQPKTNVETTVASDNGIIGEAAAALVEETPVAPPISYVATAYSLRGRTASGRPVSKGLIAADPRVLPLGSRVRLEAGNYSGEYLVADTGGAVRGRRIDIWTPTSREAMKFGRRTIKLTVLSWGGKKKASHPVKK